jgi:hypothetical protein
MIRIYGIFLPESQSQLAFNELALGQNMAEGSRNAPDGAAVTDRREPGGPIS